jgi:hypothetical protein
MGWAYSSVILHVLSMHESIVLFPAPAHAPKNQTFAFEFVEQYIQANHSRFRL